MADLGPQLIKNSYQDLLQITSSNAVQKGNGQAVTALAITSSTTAGVAPAITGNTNNRVLTATGGETINAESNLTFDGSILDIISADVYLSNNRILRWNDNQLNTSIPVLKGNYTYNIGPTNDFISGTSSLLTNGTAKIELRSSVENILGGFDSGSIAFITPQGAMALTNEGRLGIGTSSPTNNLQVVGGVTATSFTGSLLGTASLAATQSKTISFNVGSVTNALTTGSKATTTFYCPYNGKIKGFYLTSNVPATTTLDVWKASNTVPTSNANSIISSNKPQLTGNQITSSYNVSGWTTSFSVDDVFVIEVEANTGASFVNLQLITEIYN